ncbi:Soluble lytic murein transglycosylase and related regulatory proteins [Candidatus Rickettsiella viridis]|uniref:Soluble lytic murein transglycosylase and related regulatory proteins n=1 Tax=Candidatus Rickettsiella viridis TaxID=676208 RepID=A0A2Z5UW19_9COXI|nr:lytic transglycosylase domain-containing protein [Candidatus Rickettsiella viridis]BBB15816.1 Soluble lytic murein transglycosylase and related regulatory proteins [Candidatus Rickettsiella viridis]
MISALEIHGVPIECINQAAVTYHVPAKLILSILAIEGGRVGLASSNKNGSFDYGPMQINSIWLAKIQQYGYTQQQLQYDPCANVMVGTWILSQNIANASTTWRGIGGYHSHTTALNYRYQKKVSEVYQLLSHYLSNSNTRNA